MYRADLIEFPVFFINISGKTPRLTPYSENFCFHSLTQCGAKNAKQY